MRGGNLPVMILQDIRKRALQHSQPPHFGIGKTRRMFAALDAASARLYANQPHVFMLQKGIEDAHGI